MSLDIFIIGCLILNFYCTSNRNDKKIKLERNDFDIWSEAWNFQAKHSKTGTDCKWNLEWKAENRFLYLYDNNLDSRAT